MKNILLAIFAMLLITACQSRPKDFSYRNYAPINNFEEVKNEVADRLKDPESVKFRNLVERLNDKGQGMRVYCGEYNGKNSYGGYVGYSLYVAYVDDGKLNIHTNTKMQGDPFGDIITSSMCGGINNSPSRVIEK